MFTYAEYHTSLSSLCVTETVITPTGTHHCSIYTYIELYILLFYIYLYTVRVVYMYKSYNTNLSTKIEVSATFAVATRNATSKW